MRGHRWAAPWGAALLALLLAAPTGLSVTGSGAVVAKLPLQLWGPVEASAPTGLAVSGGDFEGTLRLARGEVRLLTFALPVGALRGTMTRSEEVLGGPGVALDLAPGHGAQLFARGDAALTTDGASRVAVPEGLAFDAPLGDAALREPFPRGVVAVEATHGEARVEGPLRVLLTDALVHVRRGAAPREVALGSAIEPAVPGLRMPAVPAPTSDVASLALPAVGLAPVALPELPLALGEVQVLRVLEVNGDGVLALRSHGAKVQAFGSSLALHVLGAAHVPAALGEFAFGGAPVFLRGDSAQAEGDLWLRAAPGRGQERRLQMDGAFTSFAVNGAAIDIAPPAAGAAMLAVLAGLALASPLLKPLASKLLGPLYARIPSSEVLGSGSRRKLFELVQGEPGLSLSDLAERADLSWGATVHHLGTLRRAGLVVSLRHGRYRRWFASGTCEAEQRGQVAALRNPVSARVARLVLAEPGLSQKQLADRAGMSPQAVHWHLVRLSEAGLVERRRDGREVRHFVREAQRALSAAAPPAAPPPTPT